MSDEIISKAKQDATKLEEASSGTQLQLDYVLQDIQKNLPESSASRDAYHQHLKQELEGRGVLPKLAVSFAQSEFETLGGEDKIISKDELKIAGRYAKKSGNVVEGWLLDQLLTDTPRLNKLHDDRDDKVGGISSVDLEKAMALSSKKEQAWEVLRILKDVNAVMDMSKLDGLISKNDIGGSLQRYGERIKDTDNEKRKEELGREQAAMQWLFNNFNEVVSHESGGNRSGITAQGIRKFAHSLGLSDDEISLRRGYEEQKNAAAASHKVIDAIPVKPAMQVEPKKAEVAAELKKAEVAAEPKKAEVAAEPKKVEAVVEPKKAEAVVEPKKGEAVVEPKKVEPILDPLPRGEVVPDVQLFAPPIPLANEIAPPAAAEPAVTDKSQPGSSPIKRSEATTDLYNKYGETDRDGGRETPQERLELLQTLKDLRLEMKQMRTRIDELETRRSQVRLEERPLMTLTIPPRRVEPVPVGVIEPFRASDSGSCGSSVNFSRENSCGSDRRYQFEGCLPQPALRNSVDLSDHRSSSCYKVDDYGPCNSRTNSKRGDSSGGRGVSLGRFKIGF